MVLIPCLFGKGVAFVSAITKIGSGGTWPGEIALRLNPNILQTFAGNTENIIIIAGTNGKTTTTKLIVKALEDSAEKIGKVVNNDSGANLLNGIISAYLKHTNLAGSLRTQWAVLEVDENTLPLVLAQINHLPVKRKIVVLLNLFRDQLDRYGEVDLIASKWKKALFESPSDLEIVANADDPEITWIGKNIDKKVIFFGLNRPEEFQDKQDHATDSIFCRNCGSRLQYKGVYFSHLGIWFCMKCGNKRPRVQSSAPRTPLLGLYNEYNSLAAMLVARSVGISEDNIRKSFSNFTPAFGRQEELEFDGKKIKILLSKNPAGFNASLRTVMKEKPSVLVISVNDRVPDGRDISWIWDIDFEIIPSGTKIIVTGDRVYDVAVRIKYMLDNLRRDDLILEVEPYQALLKGANLSVRKENIFVLATYSAMLDMRQIIVGRKIL